jgi:hypothetical protein
MENQTSTKETVTPWSPGDVIWGAEAIGKALGDLNVDQVYYLQKTGRLKGAVVKFGPKTMAGSQVELSRIFRRLAAR